MRLGGLFFYATILVTPDQMQLIKIKIIINCDKNQTSHQQNCIYITDTRCAPLVLVVVVHDDADADDVPVFCVH